MGGGQQGQLSGWYSVHPGAWGGAKSLIQVCCIYLPIVIIQHTSILSNCGNHTKVFQFYGLYWWILSICVFKHLWMFYGLCWVYGLVAWWVWLVGLFEMRWLYSHALVGGKAGLPLNWGDNASHTMSHVFPTSSQSHAYFVNGTSPPPTPPHKSWGGKREFIGPDDNYHQAYLEKRGELTECV